MRGSSSVKWLHFGVERHILLLSSCVSARFLVVVTHTHIRMMMIIKINNFDNFTSRARRLLSRLRLPVFSALVFLRAQVVIKQMILGLTIFFFAAPLTHEFEGSFVRFVSFFSTERERHCWRGLDLREKRGNSDFRNCSSDALTKVTLDDGSLLFSSRLRIKG